MNLLIHVQIAQEGGQFTLEDVFLHLTGRTLVND